MGDHTRDGVSPIRSQENLRRDRVELGGYGQMVRRIVRAYGRRFAAEGDDVDLADLFGLLGQVEESLQFAVDRLRERDVSWAAIGRVCGLSGERARQRWGQRKEAA